MPCHNAQRTLLSSAYSDMSGASLPLRLWANPHLERHGANGRGFCLDILGGSDNTALALDGRGVALIVCEDDPVSREGLAASIMSVGERLFGAAAWVNDFHVPLQMPLTALVRTGDGNPRWYRVEKGEAQINGDGTAGSATTSLKLLPLAQNDVRRHLERDPRPPATRTMAGVVVGGGLGVLLVLLYIACNDKRHTQSPCVSSHQVDKSAQSVYATWG